MTAPDSPTGSDDRGPGGLRLFPAADGGIARLGSPGGRLQPGDWTVLAQIASDHSSDLQLTVRGIVEVSSVRDEALLLERVEAAGLGSSIARERVRTILSSHMAGRVAGHHDVGDLPEQLDAALRRRADIAALSDEFVFGFDDGTGDVLAHCADLTAVAGPDEGLVRLYVKGRDAGLVTAIADAATVLVDAAATVAASADGMWRVSGSGESHDLVVVALSDHPLTSRSESPLGATTPGDTTPGATTSGATAPGATATPAVETPAVVVPPVGWVDTSDGLVSLLAVVPHGLVPTRLAEFLAAIERPSTVSADRVIGLHGLTEGMAEQVVRVLAPMGMVFDAESPWVTGSA